MARLPLEGIRIIDSTYVFALPYAGGLLADMGAEVIKVEGPGRPDVTRTGGYAGAFPENDLGEDWWNRPSTYNLIHRGKKSITIDMTDSRGRGMFRDLIKVSDVVMENLVSGLLPGDRPSGHRQGEGPGGAIQPEPDPLPVHPPGPNPGPAQLRDLPGRPGI